MEVLVQAITYLIKIHNVEYYFTQPTLSPWQPHADNALATGKSAGCWDRVEQPESVRDILHTHNA